MTFFPQKFFFLLVAGAFFLYAFFPFLSNGLFNSPDENANFIFSKTFAESSSFRIPEPLNAEVNGIIAPRSMKGDGNSVVPAGFLGLPLLYGALAKLAGEGAIPFFTPLLAALGLFFFYGFLRRIFEERVAFLSVVLLAFHPSFWYYAGRSMMNNVAFFVFLVAAFWCFITPRDEARRWRYFFGGLFLATSLGIRSSEALWVFIVSVFIVSAYVKEIRWSFAPWTLLGVTLAAVPVLFWNTETFGSPFAFGYAGIDSLDEASSSGGVFADIVGKIFPFGWDVKNMLRTSFEYFFWIFPWHGLGVFFGGIVFFRRYLRWEKKHFVYVIALLIVTIWLVLFYGSWRFHDNPTPGVVSIGTSYVRYFLPVYAFTLPFVALFILETERFFTRVRTQKTVTVLLAIIFIFFSARLALWSTDESIVSVERTLEEYAQKKEMVLEWTEEDSVIIAANLDKIFFPDRRVIFDITNSQVQYFLPTLASKVPIYFYSRLPERDIEYLNTKKFAPLGIRLEPYRRLSDEDELMKIIPK